MLTPGRVDEVEAAAMLSMPATAAGIGAAGRKGIAMDPLEDPPGGEPSGMAVKPNGTTEETPELKEATACAQVFSTRATSRDARAAKIPKGGGPSPENIRSLHLAYRGGQRGERTQEECSGDLAERCRGTRGTRTPPRGRPRTPFACGSPLSPPRGRPGRPPVGGGSCPSWGRRHRPRLSLQTRRGPSGVGHCRAPP